MGRGYEESPGLNPNVIELDLVLKMWQVFVDGKQKWDEEIRKRKVDVCCMQEVRWEGKGTRFVSTSERRYKLWWSDDAGSGGVGILVK